MHASNFRDKEWEPLLYRNVQRFRGGLACKAHRLLYHSSLGLRIIQKEKKRSRTIGRKGGGGGRACLMAPSSWHRGILQGSGFRV